MSEDSHEFSESDLDEELSQSAESIDNRGAGKSDTRGKELKNQPFDEALELSDASGSMSEGKNSPMKTKEVKNQPYDQALELSDSIQSPDKRSMQPKVISPISKENGAEIKNKPFDEQVDLSDSDSSVDTQQAPSPQKLSPKKTPRAEPKLATMSKPPQVEQAKSMPPTGTNLYEQNASEESSDESESEDEQSVSGITSTKTPLEGGYDENDFAHLNVSQEIKELFQYIGRFKPQDIELESKLKCFIPDYIPAVGDMDAFLKIPRPDNEADHLGLKLLDEPALIQSDATVLDLKLRAISKKKYGELVVRSIENAEKNPADVDRWIKSIADLHRTKPPPQVHYTKSMPDIDSLMQVWPENVEEALNSTPLPQVDVDVSLEEYARTICAILDIPVYKNLSESLHVLFTLYMEFSSNQHFMHQGGDSNSMQQGMQSYS